MEAIRAFIAIELPSEVRHQLDQVEKQIQARAGEGSRKAVRWVPANNMHLTLKFLGEVSSGSIPDLARILQNAANRHSGFTITVGGLGAFPNLHRPRVHLGGDGSPGRALHAPERDRRRNPSFRIPLRRASLFASPDAGAHLAERAPRRGQPGGSGADRHDHRRAGQDPGGYPSPVPLRSPPQRCSLFLAARIFVPLRIYL